MSDKVKNFLLCEENNLLGKRVLPVLSRGCRGEEPATGVREPRNSRARVQRRLPLPLGTVLSALTHNPPPSKEVQAKSQAT